MPMYNEFEFLKKGEIANFRKDAGSQNSPELQVSRHYGKPFSGLIKT